MSFAAVWWKDVRRELRGKESLQAGVVLVGLFFVLFLFSTHRLTGALAAIAVWTPMLYATAALSGRGLANEADRGTLQLMQSAPVAPAAQGWSRTLLNTLLTALLTALAIGLAAVGFGMPTPPALWAVAALAVPGLAGVGTLAGALAAQARAREVLMPLLMIPVAAPLVQAGVAGTLAALAGDVPRAPLLLMAGYDLVMLGVAAILWPLALEAD